MTQQHTPAGPASHTVIPASPSDVNALSEVIADAFFALDVSRWLVPDGAARRGIFPGYFRLYVEHAIADGLVHTTPDRAAAALWLPGAGPAEPPEGYGEQLAEVTGQWVGRFTVFDGELEAHHPAGVAHHYLAILAVRPDVQGRGIGTALLNTHHATLDQQATAAYLEASDARTRRIYLQHGYILRPNAPIRLPDGGPEMWPMWREPQPRPGVS